MRIKFCGDAGFLLLKKTDISDDLRNKITEEVKTKRLVAPKRVVVINGRSRKEEFTCCNLGMIVIDVYLSEQGNSSREYKAHNPSFVCTECLTHKGPNSYADWGFA